jgi:hypothetical protein
MIVHRIGRAYGSDIGMTAEALAQKTRRYFGTLGLSNEKEMIEYAFGKMPEDTSEMESAPDPEESS